MDKGFMFELPAETQTLIASLAAQVGSPEYQKTPVFISKPRRNRKKPVKEVSDDEWVTIRNFQKTNLNKDASETELLIDNIRKCLNKMTEVTYIAMKSEILDNMSGVRHMDDSDSKLLQIGEAIFNIATTNSMYANIYTELIKELIEIYPNFKEICDNKFTTYIHAFNNETQSNVINTDNYEELCRINLVNRKRKSQSSFFVAAFNTGLISQREIFDLIDHLLDRLITSAQFSDKTEECNEIANNIFILIKDGRKKLSNSVQLVERVTKITLMDKKKNPGLSSKCKFTFMDIKQILEKI